MKITKQNRQLWLNFFKAAEAFRDLAPWNWMYDQDMFGVKDPVTGEIGWCCIMGAAGEVFALGVYPGDEGYASYLRLLELDNDTEELDRTHAGLSQKILKIEFVNRDETDETDRKTFKELGLKYRGDNQWIQAREMLPGYLPWYLNEKQAVFLTHVLQQAMDVARRFQQDEEILENDDDNTLVRVSEMTAQGLVWEDRYQSEPEFPEKEPRQVNEFLVNRAKKELKREKAAICFTMAYMPGAVKKGEGESRPYFARIGFWIAYGSAYILGLELFTPKSLMKDFDEKFFQKLHMTKIIPGQLIVDSQMAYDLVEPICQALDIELILAPEIPDFKEVYKGMSQFMGRGMF